MRFSFLAIVVALTVSMSIAAKIWFVLLSRQPEQDVGTLMVQYLVRSQLVPYINHTQTSGRRTSPKLLQDSILTHKTAYASAKKFENACVRDLSGYPKSLAHDQPGVYYHGCTSGVAWVPAGTQHYLEQIQRIRHHVVIEVTSKAPRKRRNESDMSTGSPYCKIAIRMARQKCVVRMGTHTQKSRWTRCKEKLHRPDRSELPPMKEESQWR
ncbi:uncharacterized protein HD556DRAFT_1307214 [Suillus plorans]|uniref:Uncharacterized protein n=1 Tax=Suillus plorans TaxID=116603 RepID=A0A9P7AVF6_9AGAM|nr:uncharacterized protein HD556DRAFT_1307214 [Suillus plorans]KAG1795994.1 hypothetical protein HD556DRAFT_1307214 [Suillus plorans]